MANTDFTISLRTLEKESPEAADLLRLFSFFEPEDIPIMQGWTRKDRCQLDQPSVQEKSKRSSYCSVFCFGWKKPQHKSRQSSTSIFQAAISVETLISEPAQMELAITNLRDFSLLRRREGRGTVWLHDLTQIFANQSVPKEHTKAWLDLTIDVVYRAFPSKDETPEDQAFVDLCLRHADHVIALAQTNGLETSHYAKLMVLSAQCHHNRGRYPKALEMFGKAKLEYARHFGANSAQTVALDHKIGLTHREKGDLTTSESHHWRTLKALEGLFGREAPATLDALTDLATTVERLGRLKEAEKLFEDLSDRHKIAFGADDASTLTCMHNLALCFANQGRLAEAEALYRKVLKRSEPQKYSPDTIKTRLNLAVALDHQGHLEEAAKFYEEVLVDCIKCFGLDHSITLRVRCNISGLYRQQGRFEDAESIVRLALQKYKDVMGSDHYHTAIVTYDLAEVLHDKGALQDAKLLYEECLATMETVGADFPLTFRTIDALAILERELGLVDQSVSHARIATSRNIQLLGQDDPYTIMTENTLAESLFMQGKNQEALDRWSRCQNSFAALLDVSHPHVLMIKNNIGRSFCVAKPDDAIAQLKESEQGYLDRVGSDHNCTLIVQRNIVRAEFDNGAKGTKPVAELEKLRDAFKKSLGAAHPQVAVTEHLLGIAAASDDDLKKADISFQASVEIYKKSIGPKHPNCLLSMAFLSIVKRREGDEQRANDLRIELQSCPSIPGLGLPIEDFITSQQIPLSWRMCHPPLVYGETSRLRWGRKTCWRGAPKTELSA